jgi:hypothetical protein
MTENYTTVSIRHIKNALSGANTMKNNNDRMLDEISKIANIKAQEIFNESVKNIKNKIEEYNKSNWFVKLIKRNPKDYYGYEENMNWNISDYDIKSSLVIQYENNIWIYPSMSFHTYIHSNSIREAIGSLNPEIKKLFEYYNYTCINNDLVQLLECLATTDRDTVYLNESTMYKLSICKWWKHYLPA